VSDEAYFYLTNRIWDIERPTVRIEKPLHSEKLFDFDIYQNSLVAQSDQNIR